MWSLNYVKQSFIVCFPGAEEVRKNRIHEVHSSAAKGAPNGDVNLEDAKIGLPDIRDIPQVLKCVCCNLCSVCISFRLPAL